MTKLNSEDKIGGSNFTIQTSLLKIGYLLHKLGFVATEVVGTVSKHIALRFCSRITILKSNFFDSDFTNLIRQSQNQFLLLYVEVMFQ